jgi:hypothetical protein
MNGSAINKKIQLIAIKGTIAFIIINDSLSILHVRTALLAAQKPFLAVLSVKQYLVYTLLRFGIAGHSINSFGRL